MKNLPLLLILLALLPISSFAQTISTPPPNVGDNNGLISSNTRYETIPAYQEISYEDALIEYNKIKGSPFLHGGEITVDLITHKDSIHKDVNILYDLYNNEIIVKQKTGEDLILNQIYYKGFTLVNKKGETETYKKVHPTDRKYYQVLFQNKDFAFCKEIKTTVSSEGNYIPSEESKKKSFVHRRRHFIVHNKLVNYTKLRHDALVKNLPRKYRNQVVKLKRKLNIKKLNKEKDYLKLMAAFPKVEEMKTQ